MQLSNRDACQFQRTDWRRHDTEMKPLGRKTNSLIRTSRVPALREKITRKKRLTDRAHTFRESGLDVQKNMRRPAAGAFFYLTSPFIGQCFIELRRRPHGFFAEHNGRREGIRGRREGRARGKDGRLRTMARKAEPITAGNDRPSENSRHS